MNKTINFLLIILIPLALFDVNILFSNSISRAILLLLTFIVLLSRKISITKNALLFLIFSLNSFIVTYFNEGSLREATLVFEQFIYFVILYNAYDSLSTTNRIVKVLTVTGLVLSIGGILEYMFPETVRPIFDIFQTTDNITFYENYLIKPKTVFINPIFYSFFISISLLLGLNSKMHNKFSKLLFIFIHLTAIILVFSAGSMVLFLLVLFYYLLSRYIKVRKLNRYLYFTIFIVFISIILFYFYDLSILIKILTERVYAWRVAIRIFLDGNLIGVGLGNFNTYYFYYNYSNPISYYFNVYRTHNEFLKILVEVGFFSMIIYGLIFVNLLKKSAYMSSFKISKDNFSIRLGLHLTLIFIFLYSMIENFIMAFRSQIFIIIVFSLIEWLYEKEKMYKKGQKK